jgi:hypothetical protein
VREPEELKRFRLSEATRLTALGGEPPELNQPRLLLVQPQAKLRETLAQCSPEPLSVVTMLEAHHEVVAVAHDDHLAARVPTPPVVDPEVEHVVE